MKINHHIIIAALSAFYLSMRLANAQGNLIANGSFENNYNGWTLINTTSDQDLIGPAGLVDATNIPDGSHFAEFIGGNGEMSQTLSTTPGMFYAISLSAVQFFGTNSVSISMLPGRYTPNGINQPLATLLANLTFNTPSQSAFPGYFNASINTIWENFSFNFQAVSNITTLFFDYYPQGVAVPDNGTYDLYYGAGGLDAISVTQVVPEPSAIALVAVTMVSLTYRWRKRVKT